MRDDIVVVDANVILKLYLDEEGTEAAERLFDGNRYLFAPDFIVDEVLSVLVRNVPKKLTKAKLDEALGHVMLAISHLVPNDNLRTDAMALARELSHSYYDCLYLAPALRWDAPLVTADGKLLGKIDGSAYRG